MRVLFSRSHPHITLQVRSVLRRPAGEFALVAQCERCHRFVYQVLPRTPSGRAVAIHRLKEFIREHGRVRHEAIRISAN